MGYSRGLYTRARGAQTKLCQMVITVGSSRGY